MGRWRAKTKQSHGLSLKDSCFENKLLGTSSKAVFFKWFHLMFFNSIFSSRIYCIYHGSGGPVILNRFCALSCPFSLLGHDLSQTAPMRGLSMRSTACYCLWYLKLCIMLTSGHCTHCDMSVALCTVWHKTFLVVHGDSGLSNTTLHLNDFLKRFPCFQSLGLVKVITES